MGDGVAFGSQPYLVLLGALLFGRGMDFLSTWVGSPRLILEGNPLAKWLRWRGAIPVNLAVCILVARWPLPSVIITTMSLLLAARNFELGWLMRTLGEEGFRDWFVARRSETPISLYLFCVVGQTGLISVIGFVLMAVTGPDRLIAFGIGMGIVTFAVAVFVYTMLALWRNRRRAQY